MRLCETCGKDFVPSRPERRFCSLPCFRVSRQRRVEVRCAVCGQSFHSRLSASKRGNFYCSRHCSGIGRAKAISETLKDHPVHRANGKKNFHYLQNYYAAGNKPPNYNPIGKGLTCRHCKKNFEVHPHKIRQGKGKYCSLACYNAARYNPNQAEEQALRNSQEYKDWRTAVYRRDNYRCVVCGRNTSDLNAHHVLPFATHPDLRLVVANGVTMCEDCHAIEHARKITKRRCPDCGVIIHRKSKRCVLCYKAKRRQHAS